MIFVIYQDFSFLFLVGNPNLPKNIDTLYIEKQM